MQVSLTSLTFCFVAGLIRWALTLIFSTKLTIIRRNCAAVGDNFIGRVDIGATFCHRKPNDTVIWHYRTLQVLCLRLLFFLSQASERAISARQRRRHAPGAVSLIKRILSSHIPRLCAHCSPYQSDLAITSCLRKLQHPRFPPA